MHWYLSYPLSARQVIELLGERGIDVSTRTVLTWTQAFCPQLLTAARRHRRPLGCRCYIDEAFLFLAPSSGWLLGKALTPTHVFWTDPATGPLKFLGRARVFLRYVLGGSRAGQDDPVGLIPQARMVVVGSLLFMDAGLYFARAQAIAHLQVSE